MKKFSVFILSLAISLGVANSAWARQGGKGGSMEGQHSRGEHHNRGEHRGEARGEHRGEARGEHRGEQHSRGDHNFNASNGTDSSVTG